MSLLYIPIDLNIEFFGKLDSLNTKTQRNGLFKCEKKTISMMIELRFKKNNCYFNGMRNECVLSFFVLLYKIIICLRTYYCCRISLYNLKNLISQIDNAILAE